MGTVEVDTAETVVVLVVVWIVEVVPVFVVTSVVVAVDTELGAVEVVVEVSTVVVV